MIRKVQTGDAAAITSIYNEYVLSSTATFDTETQTETGMRERLTAISARFPYFVYEEDGEVAGYCYAHEWKAKAAYAHTLETTVYVKRGYTGRSIGRKLTEHLIEACREQGFGVLIACITAENAVSIRLHERLGFRRMSYFEAVGRKFGRLLDVTDYVLHLNPSGSPRQTRTGQTPEHSTEIIEKNTEIV